jgi:hypothetical protein
VRVTQFRRLNEIGRDVFRLRNAYIHGLPIPDGWLATDASPVETGYAYQLVECTEILLRMTLLRILEDKALFKVFCDPKKLDAQFL